MSGQGRNNITRQLNTAGLKVSHGSVSNIIIKYKRQYEQSLQSNTNTNNASVVAPPQPSQEVVQGPPSDAGIGTGIPMNISAGSPLLMTCSASAGTGQAQTKSNFNITPRDGGPLSHFLGEEEVMSNLQSPTSTVSIPPKPFPDIDLLMKNPEEPDDIINQDVITQNAAPEGLDKVELETPVEKRLEEIGYR